MSDTVFTRIVFIQRFLSFLAVPEPLLAVRDNFTWQHQHQQRTQEILDSTRFLLQLRRINTAFDETIRDYGSDFLWTKFPAAQLTKTLFVALTQTPATAAPFFFQFRQAVIHGAFKLDRPIEQLDVKTNTAPLFDLNAYTFTADTSKALMGTIIPLNLACYYGNAARVHELLEIAPQYKDWIRGGAQVWEEQLGLVGNNNKHFTSSMPLHEICMNADNKKRGSEVVELAGFFIETLQHPVNVLHHARSRPTQLFNFCRRTPLAMAAANGHVELVRLLLQHGGADAQKLKSEGDGGLWPVHFAARSVGKSYVTTEETIECFKLLLEHGRTVGGEPNLVDKVDDSGNTPLNIAVKNQNYEVVRWLVEVAGANVLGPSVGQGGSRDWQPLSIACACPPSETNAKIVDLLLARGANSNNTRPLATNNANPVYLATNQAMRAYDERGPRPRVPYPHQLIVLQRLLQPDEQQAGGQQRKPLFDPNTEITGGQTPLHLVCSMVSSAEPGMLDEVGLPIMKLLLAAGANPHGGKRADGWTPFLKCYTRKEMASLLVQKDPAVVAARLNKPALQAGFTALHLMCDKRSSHLSYPAAVSMLSFLIDDCKCDVNARDASGSTPLDVLMRQLSSSYFIGLATELLTTCSAKLDLSEKEQKRMRQSVKDASVALDASDEERCNACCAVM